jgi:type I restriction enzyme S subunit
MRANSTDRSNGDTVLEAPCCDKNQTVSAEDQSKSIRGGKGNGESSEVYPGISGSRNLEFTEIAPDWDAITLGNEHPQTLLAIRNGLTLPQDQDRGEYKVSRIETIGDGWINDSRVRYASNVPEKDVEKYLIKKGDILFSHINSDPHIGKTGFADRDYEDLLHGMNLLLIRANPQVFEPEFLNRVFQYYRDIGVFTSICSRAVNQSSINQAKLKALEVPLPPLPEQKKIAHILSTVQRAIEAQERIIKTTTALKKALMHKLFTEGLRGEPQKQTEIGPVPESWATPTIESVCTIKASAMSYSQLEKASNVSDGVRAIGIKVSDMNLPGNEIEFRSANLERLLTEKEARKRTVPPHSIIFPKRGAAIATNKKRLTTGYTVLDPNLIAVMPSEAVSHRYLFHWFNTFDLKTITDPGPTPQLNKKDIAPLKFPMPPIEEQQAIAATIDAAEEKATLHIRKRDQFQALFRTLLHDLMTAKTRVNLIKCF